MSHGAAGGRSDQRPRASGGVSVPVTIGVKRSPATRPTAGAFGDSIFVIDQSRCIGCEACVHACEECGTHRGHSMIHLDEIDRSVTTQTVPMVCMHCEDPTCAEVCPADAIKQNEDGVVQSSLKPRCIGCSNCVLACPFGVPKYLSAFDQMMKCDMCYDRTAVGLKPMCASVCPSQALWFGTAEEFYENRSGHLVNEWWFGSQYVATKVRTVAVEPRAIDVAGASGARPWQDDPFGLDDPGGEQ